MVSGKIVKTGDYSLVREIEKDGYSKYTRENLKETIGTCAVKEMINNE